MLGSAYAVGAGVPTNGVLAHLWLNRSADGGHPRANRILARLESKLSASQIREARRRKGLKSTN